MSIVLTLVIDFGAIFSSKALVLKSFIIHIKLFHHVVVELVPTSPGATTETQRKIKMKSYQVRKLTRIVLKQINFPVLESESKGKHTIWYRKWTTVEKDS